MPIYEFSCSNCKHTFDELLSVSERDKPVACPACGKTTHRKVSLPASRRSGTRSACTTCSSGDCSNCGS